MKYLSALIGLTFLTLTAQAAPPQPDLLVKIYFAGAQKIAANPHASSFTNEFSSPEALALRAQVAAKLSAWLAGWLAPNPSTSIPDGPSKLRPLFDDLQQSEFLLEIRAATPQPETAIAIKLPPARAQLWQDGLKPFFPAATFKNSDGWLIFDSNPALLGLGNKVATQLTAPPQGWLNLDINWPSLAQWHPQFKTLGLPETHFVLTNADNNLNLTAKFHFPNNLVLKLDPWRLPTNTIHAPFDSFTAARAIGPWLGSQTWAQSFLLSPTPNQLFVWSMPGPPFLTFAAAPVPNAPAAVAESLQHLTSAIDAARTRNELMTPMRPEMKDNDLVLAGVPFVSARIRPISEASGQFWFAELFPNPSAGAPLPKGLLDRLATKNLLFYHWENTPERIPEMLQISQLGLMLTEHKQLDGKSAAFKWLRQAGARPGPSETGITQTGPDEFTFSRVGPNLFTATELFVLANWVESPNFPGFEFQPAPSISGSPAPAPPAAPAHHPAGH